MGEWFIDWFNTPEYLEVYKHRNINDGQMLVDLISANIFIKPRMRVLDMACGTGRYSILFARLGCKVTAFDFSNLLLGEAKKMARAEQLEIEFHKVDIRNFSFDRQFDLVINLFTSFGYFESDEQNVKVLQAAYEHLRKGGSFVLDYFNPNFIKANLIKRSADMIDGSELIQERFIEKDRVKKRITIKKNSHDEIYYEDIRLYSCRELQDMLCKSGFSIVKVFGDYMGSDFDSLNSPRLIIIASK